MSKALKNVRKLDDIVNVKDFGATGNGLTDDSAAIQAAVSYAQTIGRNQIVIPAGQYVIGTQITASNCDLTVVGAGVEATVILVQNTAGFISFNSTGRTVTAHRFEISGMSIVANGAGSISRTGCLYHLPCHVTGSCHPALLRIEPVNPIQRLRVKPGNDAVFHRRRLYRKRAQRADRANCQQPEQQYKLLGNPPKLRLDRARIPCVYSWC